MKRRTWTTLDRKYIADHLHLTDKQLADHFGCSPKAVYDFRNRNNLPKKGKVDYLFQKGLTPHNKGKKHKDYLTPESYQRVLEGLAKGPQSIKKRAIGETFWYPSAGQMCINLEGKPKASYAKYVWEQAHGVTLGRTTGMIHLDGDKRNCDLSNLRPETSAERIRRVLPAEKRYRGIRKAVQMKQEPYQFYSPYKQAS
jgi:hypothetical protein